MGKMTNLRLRLRAAGWAAVVALLLTSLFSVYLLLFDLDYPVPIAEIASLMFLVIVLPVIAAGISGYFVGWQLVNPEWHHHTPSAIILGLFTGLAAYPILFFVCIAYFLLQVVVLQYPFRDPSYTLVERTVNIVWVAFVTAGYGFLLVGWITVPLSCLAGYWLSKRYRGKHAVPSIAGN